MHFNSIINTGDVCSTSVVETFKSCLAGVIDTSQEWSTTSPMLLIPVMQASQVSLTPVMHASPVTLPLMMDLHNV
jgi:hypothetical protein